jgi:tripartite-type tricarboxylate transporter receptor subunit TctC
LAVTTRQRSKALPAAPTLIEAGVKDFDVSSFYGIAAPAGTPADVIARMELALQKVLKMADVSQAMESRGADVGFLNASVMGAFMAADAAKWKRVASFAKITLG